MAITILGKALKIRVGRVRGKTQVFFFLCRIFWHLSVRCKHPGLRSGKINEFVFDVCSMNDSC
jgi:hypothetical protein